MTLVDAPALTVLGDFLLRWDADRPLSLAVIDHPWIGRADVPLIEVFTAREQRARTSQAYTRSAVGERLRVQRVDVDGDRAVAVQTDPRSGLRVRTELVATTPRALRVVTTLTNASAAPIVVTAAASASVGIGTAESDLDALRVHRAASEWLAENRWRSEPLRELLPDLSLGIHGQDGRGHAGWASHGAWSTGEHLPTAALVHPDGGALGWQIETSAGWQVDLSQGLRGAVVSLLGPTDAEHHFAHRLEPGASFELVPVTLVRSEAGFDGAVAELTAARRRRRADAHGLPVVYNDFMNTLMGQPSTEKLDPLITAAAAAGAEVFCIDAGWFADPVIGDWWSTVGEWREAPSRFTGGLRALIERIHAAGMRSGLWLEPEVVGASSRAATALPEAAFFHRHGARVQEHERYHLDFRHPAARAHLDEVVDRLVGDYGVSYLKLDYNINPGPGTEDGGVAAGDGLLGHTRALRDWLEAVQHRHPTLIIENCSSGAMRADEHLLSVTHLQSTSDQQDFVRYPPIAASAPASILPEQCGNWAYPAADMTDDETAFTLVTGLSGRLYLSGFLDALRPAQQQLVADAVRVHRSLRHRLPEAVPFWPLGMPGWDDQVIALGLRGTDDDLVFVWDRRPGAGRVDLPIAAAAAAVVFPPDATAPRLHPDGIEIDLPAGPSARMLRVIRSEATS